MPALDAEPVDGGGHASPRRPPRAARGRRSMSGGRAASSRTRSGRSARAAAVRAAAETQRGVEHAMAAVGELLHQLLRPLESRVPEDHRQADHVVAVRADRRPRWARPAVSGRESTTQAAAAPDLASRIAPAANTTRPSGYSPTFSQTSLGELAGLAAGAWPPARAKANSGGAGRASSAQSGRRLVVIWRSRGMLHRSCKRRRVSASVSSAAATRSSTA